MKQFLVLIVFMLSSISIGNPLENCKRFYSGMVSGSGTSVTRINSAIQGFYQTYPYVTPMRDTSLSDRVNAVGKDLQRIKEWIEQERKKSRR